MTDSQFLEETPNETIWHNVNKKIAYNLGNMGLTYDDVSFGEYKSGQRIQYMEENGKLLSDFGNHVINYQKLSFFYKSLNDNYFSNKVDRYINYLELMCKLRKSTFSQSRLLFDIEEEGVNVYVMPIENVKKGTDYWLKEMMEILTQMGYIEQVETIKLKKIFSNEDARTEVEKTVVEIKKEFKKIKRAFEYDLKVRIQNIMEKAREEAFAEKMNFTEGE